MIDLGIVFILVSALALAVALSSPFHRGLCAFVALLPFMNAYGAALTAAALVGRALCVNRFALFALFRGPALAALIFFAVILTQSLIVALDVARLASEAVQWVLGIGLFSLVLFDRDPTLTRGIATAFAIGALLLGGGQLVANASGVELSDEVNTVFLRSDANNYAALYYLVGLVLLPLRIGNTISTKYSWLMVGLGLVLIVANESRAQLATGILVLLYFVLARAPRGISLLLVSAGVAGIWLFFGSPVVSASLSDSRSPLSLFNFETNYSNLERLGLLLYSAELFLTNPMGYGIGSSSLLFPVASQTVGSYPTPHNTLAMLMVEGGVVGVAAYVLLAAALVAAALNGLNQRNTETGPLAVGLLMITVLEAVFFNGVVATVFWIALAIVFRREPGSRGGRYVAIRALKQRPCAESPV